MASPPFFRSLVLWSVAVMLLLVAAIIYTRPTLPPGEKIDTSGQPTIGYPKAKVHVVVFEEPKCPDCKRYNNTIFQQIKKEFIDTNQIRYTVIPVSFLPNSMPAAVALLCAYHQDEEYTNADQYFTLLDYLYANQPPEQEDWATVENLQEMAKKASPAIHLDQLKNCIEQESYRVQIAKNTEYGAKLMNGLLSTPSIYVNGIRADKVSLSTIKKLISEVQKTGAK